MITKDKAKRLTDSEVAAILPKNIKRIEKDILNSASRGHYEGSYYVHKNCAEAVKEEFKSRGFYVDRVSAELLNISWDSPEGNEE